MNTENFSQLEREIGIIFKNKDLLKNVFIHRSYLNEHKQFYLPSNEKLEFLGDSVLSLITSMYLYKNYPTLHEGEYTDIKSAIVRTESLAVAAGDLNLGMYLHLSRGEEQGNGRTNTNILADCFEALIAGIFIDKNFETAFSFVVKYLFKGTLDTIIAKETYLSAKSKLQELMQAKYKTIPLYKVLEEQGPDHNRFFKIGVFLNSKKLAEGEGRSKKEAEEQAAEIAFDALKK